MKKLFLFVTLVAALCLTGCGSLSDKEIKDNFIKDIESLKSYYMEGSLKLINNDDSYEYDVEVSYQKDDNYKVSLNNKGNNYEQIILKNKEGVYVITPSLNKSFKFQSDWPDNNSQSYLLGSVVNDLKKDNEYKFTQKDSDYIYTVKTNYPNNPKYIKQNIILDKNYNLKKVEVQDDKNISYIEFTVKTIDKKANFNESEFSLEELTKDFNKASTNEEQTRKENSNNEESKQTENRNQEEQTNEQTNEEAKTDNETQSEDRNESKTNSETIQNNQTEETNETSKVDDKVFPLYLPSNTKLSDKEVIATESGERVIMTFAGDNPFILVQETVKPSKNLEIIPTYGEPYMLIDTVGSLTDTSYTWTSNGVEYYIVSDQMDKNELLEVAKSINVVSTINQK